MGKTWGRFFCPGEPRQKNRPRVLSAACVVAVVGTSASWLPACEPAYNYRCRAAGTCIYFNCARRAVQGACSAFYAGILSDDLRFFPTYSKHSMRTDFGAASATGTLPGVIGKRCYVFQIPMPHLVCLLLNKCAPSVNAAPAAAAPTMKGSAFFISFTTPDGDV